MTSDQVAYAVASYDVASYDVASYDVASYDVASYGVASYDMALYDWHPMTWSPVTWHLMTWHAMTWPERCLTRSLHSENHLGHPYRRRALHLSTCQCDLAVCSYCTDVYCVHSSYHPPGLYPCILRSLKCPVWYRIKKYND